MPLFGILVHGWSFFRLTESFVPKSPEANSAHNLWYAPSTVRQVQWPDLYANLQNAVAVQHREYILP